MKKRIMENLDQLISSQYQSFFKKLEEVNNIAVKDWKVTELLGYFCQKYQEYYHFKFTFSFNGVPSKCYEMVQMKKLANMLSSDPEILKHYIDWIFEKKVKERKRKISSLGYLTNVGLVNEYKFAYLLKPQITRSSILSPRYLNIIKESGIEITTYGELAFVRNIARTKSPEDKHYKLCMRLKENGFDFKILDGMK